MLAYLATGQESFPGLADHWPSLLVPVAALAVLVSLAGSGAAAWLVERMVGALGGGYFRDCLRIPDLGWQEVWDRALFGVGPQEMVRVYSLTQPRAGLVAPPPSVLMPVEVLQKAWGQGAGSQRRRDLALGGFGVVAYQYLVFVARVVWALDWALVPQAEDPLELAQEPEVPGVGSRTHRDLALRFGALADLYPALGVLYQPVWARALVQEPAVASVPVQEPAALLGLAQKAWEPDVGSRTHRARGLWVHPEALASLCLVLGGADCGFGACPGDLGADSGAGSDFGGALPADPPPLPADAPDLPACWPALPMTVVSAPH